MPTIYNPKTRHFERDGKPIRPADVRQWVAETVNSAKARMESIAKGYVEHRNSAELAVSLREEIRNMHTAMAMVAQGGKDQMTNSAWAKVGNVVKTENAYLRGFERDVANGRQSDAQILARAMMYADSAYKTYENGVLQREKDAGAGYARRVLDDAAEHCEDCPSLATEEFLDITEVAEIGDSTCGGRCRCTIVYADVA
jgi:hypothetical protein